MKTSKIEPESLGFDKRSDFEKNNLRLARKLNHSNVLPYQVGKKNFVKKFEEKGRVTCVRFVQFLISDYDIGRRFSSNEF